MALARFRWSLNCGGRVNKTVVAPLHATMVLVARD